jgi:site-specific recombinase XerD
MKCKSNFLDCLINLKPYFVDGEWEKEPKIDNPDGYQLWLWMRRVKFNYPQNTFNAYRTTLFRFILWLSNRNLRLSNISEFHFDDYKLFLKNIPDELKGMYRGFSHQDWLPFARKALSDQTIMYNMQLVRQFISDMFKSGYLVRNPFYFPLRKKNVVNNLPQHRYLEQDEVLLLLDFINSHYTGTIRARNIWLITLLIYTGLRRNELVQATMRDVIFKHGNWYLKTIGKGSKYAEIPMVPELIEALNEYRSHYGLKQISPDRIFENIPLVINDRLVNKYQGYAAQHVYHIIRGICLCFAKELQPGRIRDKMERLTPHWLRHTSATLQINMGVDPLVVQQNLRHNEFNTTLLYVHLSQRKQYDETAAKFRL